MDTYNIYKDIQARTRGEIYIGVVGPVRTGKSTFVRRFMELTVQVKRQLLLEEVLLLVNRQQ